MWLMLDLIFGFVYLEFALPVFNAELDFVIFSDLGHDTNHLWVNLN